MLAVIHSKIVLRVTVAVVAALMLGACASPAQRGTEVTRFHLNQPITQQSVHIAPGEGMDDSSIEYSSYRQIVATQLTTLGFEVTDDDTASLRADLLVKREAQQVAPKSSGMTIGIGMGSYGRSGGIGGGVSAPVGGRKGGEVFATTLSVQLIDTAENAIVWEGDAVNTADATPGSPVEAVRNLAAALFADFPGESGKTVTVPDPAP